MGIPYYFYTLTKKYGDIVSTDIPCIPDIYCMDFNGVIHPVCADIINNSPTLPSDKDIISKLYSKVFSDITELNPHKTLVCIDGVVPLAKMIQQRKRRYLSVFRNKIDKVDVKWDTNCITPGTTFMTELNIYFKKNLMYNNKHKIVFSGSDEFGEGEHKIFKLLKCENDNIKIIINGMDADLIILSLISHRKNIYLMREGTEEKTFVNINKLRCAIIHEITERWNITKPDDMYCENACDIIETYCVMCSLLGNDFIPHLLTLNLKSNGLEHLLDATSMSYGSHGLLVVNSQINQNALIEILQYIAKSEDNDIFEETKRYMLKNSHNLKNTKNSEYYAIKHKHPIAEEIYSNISSWRHIYYKKMFYTNPKNNSSIVSQSCVNFIRGIYWTYEYYKQRQYDNEWYYPYSYPPSIKDLVNHMIGNVPQYIINTSETKEVLTTDIQLIIVLPRDSTNLLNEKYQNIIKNPSNGLMHLYPTEYKINTFLKTHLWECEPVLPTINIKYIRKHINL